MRVIAKKIRPLLKHYCLTFQECYDRLVISLMK